MDKIAGDFWRKSRRMVSFTLLTAWMLSHSSRCAFWHSSRLHSACLLYTSQDEAEKISRTIRAAAAHHPCSSGSFCILHRAVDAVHRYFAGEHKMCIRDRGMLILVCVAIYAVLIQGIATGGDPIGAIWGTVGYTVLLCFMPVSYTHLPPFPG